jgi:hypothetical protein
METEPITSTKDDAALPRADSAELGTDPRHAT